MCRFRAAVVGITVVGLGAFTAPAHAQDDSTASGGTTDQVRPSVLAVVDAESGTFADDRLVLRGVGPRALWFTERPAREAGTLTVPELTRAFFTRQQPPNAALEFAGAGEKNDVAMVELSEPRYDRREQQLTFEVRMLQDDPTSDLDPNSALKGFASRNDAEIASKFGAATLFIDSFPVSAACDLQIANNTSDLTLQVQDSTAGADWLYDGGGQALQDGETLPPGETWDIGTTNYWNPPCGVTFVLIISSGSTEGGGYDISIENPSLSASSWSCADLGTPPAACEITGNAHGEPLVVDVSIDADG